MISTEPVSPELTNMGRRNELICGWSGAAAAALLIIGWCIVAGFLPPPSPNLSANEIAEYWRNDTELKILGMVIGTWGGVCYAPFSIAITMRMLRMGKHNRVLAYAQGAVGAFATVFVTVPLVFLMVVGFRPERPVELTQLMNDLSFIFALTTVMGFSVQNILIGLATIQDRSEKPVFPRWVAYFNFWLALVFVPAALIPFFKTGPFAWNGVLSFWLPVGLFVVWLFVMVWAVTQSIRSQYAVTAGTPNASVH